MNLPNRLATCLVALAFLCASCESRKTCKNSYVLSLIHFSDFHSRYVPVSPSGGLCYDVREKCIGGIARVWSIASRLKQIRPNALFLNAGDNFQGTLYYDIYRGNITAAFMNELPHDAMTIGNHDFDDGPAGFAAYAKQLRAPIVASNIDISDEPSMKNTFTNSVVVKRGGKQIGIIGVIASNTDKISSTTGKLKFLDEIASVNAEAKRLKAKGVNIIVVLSHCGIDHDKVMASSCPDVNVIVGGHSHVLLWNGKNKPPSGDVAYDKYPIRITPKGTNKTVLVVHAGAFTKYVGDLRVIFSKNDEIVGWMGNPIYLNNLVQEDPKIDEKLQPWKAGVDKVGKVRVGEAKVFLNGSCSSGECNFADLITDGMVDKYPGDATISLNSANNIQNSIPAGHIVFEDIYMSLPYNNTWNLVELKGVDLMQVLEENVAKSASNASFVNDKLLLWSGLKVTYNLTSKASKVIDVRVRNLQDPEKFDSLDLQRYYHIVVPSYLCTPAFETIQKNIRILAVSKTRDVENLINYIKKFNVIDIKTGSRMIFV